MTSSMSQISIISNTSNQPPTSELNNQDTKNEVQVQSHPSPVSPACTRFFAISELLEMMLLQVPPLKLLVIQRVNRQFRDTISISTPLQQKLFFKPNQNTNKENNHSIEWNPLVLEPDTYWDRLHPETNDPSHHSRKFRLPHGTKAGELSFMDPMNGHTTAPTSQLRDSQATTDLANIHLNASWKRMFVSQPPLCRVSITKYCGDGSNFRACTAGMAAKEGSEGCTMEDLYEFDWKGDMLYDDCYVNVRKA